MRKIVHVQPCFTFNLTPDKKIVRDYRNKYDRISALLDENPGVLQLVHKDLEQLGSDKGKGSDFSSEQMLRAILVMIIEQLPYRETVIRITESDFLRNFTRIGVGKVMSHPFLCAAFKCIRPETWKTVNNLLTNAALEGEKISGNMLRLDSTVCESNIHYPTDAFLLWDSYRVVSRIMRQCCDEEPLWDMKNRFHVKKSKKLYVYVATHGSKKSDSTKRAVTKKFKELLGRVRILCETADRFISNSRTIPTRNEHALELLESLIHFQALGLRVVEQSHRAWVLKETVPASERVFSIFEEHTELLKRGKAGKPVEFGHMVSIGQTEEKFISYYDVREKSLHDIEIKKDALKEHKKKFKQYPDSFTADKNYYESMDDIKHWEKKIDTYAIAKKGRKNEQEILRESDEEFTFMQRFRAGVEGSISVLKRAFGLRRCFFKGFKSFASAVGCLVFCHNLVVLTRL
jgi:IS5 family transposase